MFSHNALSCYMMFVVLCLFIFSSYIAQTFAEILSHRVYLFPFPMSIHAIFFRSSCPIDELCTCISFLIYIFDIYLFDVNFRSDVFTTDTNCRLIAMWEMSLIYTLNLFYGVWLDHIILCSLTLILTRTY